MAVRDLAGILKTTAKVWVRAEVGPVNIVSTPVARGVVVVVHCGAYQGLLSKDRSLGMFYTNVVQELLGRELRDSLREGILQGV